MRIGLASYRVENKNTEFNISQIERAMKEAEGKADLLCFGEAVLQGFDSLGWNYKEDKEMAVSLNSEIMGRLKKLTVQYGMGIAFGYIEKAGEFLYSSYVVIDAGEIVHNYRRISRGWKEYDRTDDHYCEGCDIEEFSFRDKKIMTGLCGDLWDYPEKFKTKNLLLCENKNMAKGTARASSGADQALDTDLIYSMHELGFDTSNVYDMNLCQNVTGVCGYRE